MSEDIKHHGPDFAAVAEKVIRRRDELLAEQAKLMEQRHSIITQLRRIDRELADCRATARFFALEIEFPTNDPELVEHVGRERIERERAIRVAMIRQREVEAAAISARVYSVPAGFQSSRAPPPTLREFILARLKAVGMNGSKASPLREFYERTYGKAIHEKTVGMTLYRLQNESLVRRDGHTWFLAQPMAETRNPGVAAPGPNNP